MIALAAKRTQLEVAIMMGVIAFSEVASSMRGVRVHWLWLDVVGENGCPVYDFVIAYPTPYFFPGLLSDVV